MKEISRTIYTSISDPIIKACVFLGITSNQITILNHILTLTFGCYFFSRGEYAYGIFGLFICFINGFLDYLDGDVARATNKFSQLGVWLDSGFDVVVQNAVMGAIAIGCYKQGLPLIWIVMFFIGNSANNFVSFNYNAKFGFDSDKGNELFRKIMARKSHVFNKIIRDIIDPTSNYISLIFYTYRYWILFGFLFGIMPILFIAITVINNFKWIVMFSIYALYLSGENRLFVLKALSSLDSENDDFYSLRNCA